jgi:tetratricopeptide (TPR) repeat protein
MPSWTAIFQYIEDHSNLIQALGVIVGAIVLVVGWFYRALLARLFRRLLAPWRVSNAGSPLPPSAAQVSNSPGGIAINSSNVRQVQSAGDQSRLEGQVYIERPTYITVSGAQPIPPTVLPPPHAKPPPVVDLEVPDFVGREADEARLLAALKGGGRASICAIGGMGGVGKTELAKRVASKLKRQYPHGQVLVDMQGTLDAPLPPEQAMREVLQEFDREGRFPAELKELAPLYGRALQDKRVLLLLDNAKDYQQVKPLLPPEGCGLLVTSRATIWLDGGELINLKILAPEPARELLASITRKRAFPANDLDRIAERCGYLPLALRAAGIFLAVHEDWGVEEYLQKLSSEKGRLERLKVQDIDVAATLGLSAAQLKRENPELYERWRMLAVFPAPFARIAAAEVWDLDESEARDGLSTLISGYSLALYDGETTRYRLHDLMRDVAKGLSEPDDPAVVAAHRRHAKHFVKVLGSADGLFLKGGEDLLKGLGLFDQERRHIEAGRAWAAAHAKEDEAATRLADEYPDAGVYVLGLRLHPREQISWLDDALAAARALGDRRGEGNHLGNLGIRYADLGEPRKAIGYHEQGLAISREIGDRRGEGNHLGSLGNCYAELGEPRKAIEHYEQALAISREIGDRRGEGNRLGNLGNCYAELGEPRKAIGYHEQALAISREIGDRRGEGNHLGSLGNRYAELDEPRKAIEHYEQALAISREIGDRRGEGNRLGNLGNCYAHLGEPRKAIGYHEQALAISREIGDRRGEGADLGNLGNRYAELGEPRKAIEHHEQALAISREIGDRRGESNRLFNMAGELIKLGERDRALPLARESLRIKEEIEDPRAEKVRAALARWEQQAKP